MRILSRLSREPHFRSGSLPDLVAVGIFLFDLGVFDTAQSEGNGAAHVREDINRQTRVEPERQFQVVAERASEGAFGFVGKLRITGLHRKIYFTEKPEVSFAVQSRIGAEIEADRQCTALQVEVFEGQIDVVLLSQIEIARVQRSVDVGVSETDAGRHVVLEEVAYRGVDGEDTAVQIQVVQDQQVVRVVA